LSETGACTVTGRIFEIQRFCIHDGPGIRTTVFMKGCPLRCVWCHNPEGISPEPELSFLPERCIGCRYCASVCPNEAHQMVDGRHELDRSRCAVCGRCTERCYAEALEYVGREVTVAEALEEVLRDRPFYETSGGGLTLSGGEPMMQATFAEALLAAAKQAGLHCCVETCGFCDWRNLEHILPLVDLFLYDLKETDPARHVEYTGARTDRIVENLRALHNAGARVLVRLPIVPGLNDRSDHFEGIAKLARELPRLLGVEIMPYHRLGTSKLRRFGRDEDRLGQIQPAPPAQVGEWIAALRRLGVHVKADSDETKP